MYVGIQEVAYTKAYNHETFDGPEMFCVLAGAVFGACCTSATYGRWTWLGT